MKSEATNRVPKLNVDIWTHAAHVFIFQAVGQEMIDSGTIPMIVSTPTGVVAVVFRLSLSQAGVIAHPHLRLRS